MKKIEGNKYEGFSLVEMIITIFILGVVMVICATTLTTLIRVSTISEAKNTTRTDVDFTLEIVNRSLSSANLEDIHLYNTSTYREYDPENNTIVDTTETLPLGAYSEVASGDSATEVHIRSYGFNRWTCIGLFKGVGSEDPWYIVKTSTPTLTNPEDCFTAVNDKYLIPLNSSDVSINTFVTKKVELELENSFLTIDVVAEPVHWPVGTGNPVSKEVGKQITVSTQGLTWYY